MHSPPTVKPADTNRIGGAMRFSVNGEVLMQVVMTLSVNTISVGFDGKVTLQ